MWKVGLGRKWPQSAAVDSESFIGRLRAKTGLKTLDLPTEAQWEYACRAGTTTAYNTGNSEASLAAAAWYGDSIKGYHPKVTSTGSTMPVGEKLANAWGLYDMHGNVCEMSLDWNGAELIGENPVGAVSGGWGRVVKGGSYYEEAEKCTSLCRFSISPKATGWGLYDQGDNIGFRLFRTVP